MTSALGASASNRDTTTNRPRLRRQTQIDKPDLTGTWVHPEYPARPARTPSNAAHRVRPDPPARSSRSRANGPDWPFRDSIDEVSRLVSPAVLPLRFSLSTILRLHGFRLWSAALVPGDPGKCFAARGGSSATRRKLPAWGTLSVGRWGEKRLNCRNNLPRPERSVGRVPSGSDLYRQSFGIRRRSTRFPVARAGRGRATKASECPF